MSRHVSALTCAAVLHQLDAAALALHGGRHVARVAREVERVEAARVIVGVAVEAADLLARCNNSDNILPSRQTCKPHMHICRGDMNVTHSRTSPRREHLMGRGKLSSFKLLLLYTFSLL